MSAAEVRVAAWAANARPWPSLAEPRRVTSTIVPLFRRSSTASILRKPAPRVLPSRRGYAGALAAVARSLAKSGVDARRSAGPGGVYQRGKRLERGQDRRSRSARTGHRGGKSAGGAAGRKTEAPRPLGSRQEIRRAIPG